MCSFNIFKKASPQFKLQSKHVFDKLCLVQDLVIQGSNDIFEIPVKFSIILEGQILALVTHALHCQN